MYEANFNPTYIRKESTFFTEEEDDNLEDLTPTETTFDQLLSCLEQQLKDESGKLNDKDEDLILKALQKGNPDPKSQKEIDKLSKEEQKRYNDATKAEYEGMKAKEVMEFVRFTDVPKECKVYICIVNWLTKYVLGVYSKTKCRICFGGHHYMKTFTDCFAPTVNFCSVLIVLCLAAMFGWHLGSLDYSHAYLNANIDEECYLRAPEFLREYDKDGVELVWKLKKVIYGHPKGSRLWAECLDKNLKQLGFKQFQTDQCVYGKWINWDKQSQQRILFHPGIGAFRRPYCDIKFKGKNVIRERIPAVPIRRYRPRNAKIFLWSGNRYLRQQNITWNELLLEQSHEEIWN
jgi:hypothetical protein